MREWALLGNERKLLETNVRFQPTSIHAMSTIMKYATAAIAFISIMTSPAEAQIARHKNSAHLTQSWAREFAESIEVPSTARSIVLSGVGPLVANKSAPIDSVAAYGDTETQTKSVLSQIEEILTSKGYAMADVVSMQALIVGDPQKNGEADFKAFSDVYNTYFGTATQPNVPARTRAQVIRLVPPGWLVEVTVVASKLP